MTMIIIYNKKRTRTRTRIQIRIFWPHSAGGHIRTVQITDMEQSQIEGFVEFVTISRVNKYRSCILLILYTNILLNW